MLTTNSYALNVSGQIDSDTIWTLADSPVIVTDHLTILDGVTLTIQPGVVVKLNFNVEIYIDGTLKAIGTESQHITFTANSENPGPGFWKQLYFSSATDSSWDSSYNYLDGCVLIYCDIEYAITGVKNRYTNLLIKNTTISKCREQGLNMDNIRLALVQSLIENNGTVDISNNTGALFCNVSGTILYTTFRQNKGRGGAGIRFDDCDDLEVKHSIITENVALSSYELIGGGVWSSSSRLLFNNSDITNNVCNSKYGHLGHGGGIGLTTYYDNLSMNNCVINNNYATGRGSAILSRKGNLVLENCLVQGNNCPNQFAAIQTGDVDLHIAGSMVQNNTGVGLAFYDTKFNLFSSIVA